MSNKKNIPKKLFQRNSVNAGIAGIGTYVPEQVLTNYELEKIVDTSDEWIKSKTGIFQRHIASQDEATSDLAVIAGRKAIEDAQIQPDEIDLIIVATATPDMLFPSTACIVQDRLGAVNAAAFDVSAGCTGFIYAMSVASQFIKAKSYKNILVIGSETLSKIINWEDRNTCVLFGDGAGAVVLRPVSNKEGIIAFQLGADGHGSSKLTMPAGGSRMPASFATVENKLHAIHMNGPEVYKFATRIMVEITMKVLKKAKLEVADLDLVIPHQANIRIIESAAKKLGLPLERFLINISQYANTSSASIPIALEEAIASRKVKDGSSIILTGFGSGLTFGAVAIKWFDHKK